MDHGNKCENNGLEFCILFSQVRANGFCAIFVYCSAEERKKESVYYCILFIVLYSMPFTWISIVYRRYCLRISNCQLFVSLVWKLKVWSILLQQNWAEVDSWMENGRKRERNDFIYIPKTNISCNNEWSLVSMSSEIIFKRSTRI